MTVGMDQKIHVSRNKDSLGVFTEDQLRTAISRGSVYASDYCWKSGMKAWATIGQTYPHLLPSQPSSQPSPPAYPAAHAHSPGQVHSQTGQAPASPVSHAHSNVTFPTGGDRFCAYLLDTIFMMLLCCVLAVPMFVIMAVIADSGGREADRAMRSLFQLVGYGFGFFGPLVYYGVLGNTSQNATWGQRIMGFKMVDSRTGSAPRAGQVWSWSLYRSLILTCCSCVGLLFFIPILNDARKQSAFDNWSDILMVRR
jgi:uncharacterized RDD family membrane protein YckC